MAVQFWPRGLVGSLTHCDGYRAAAVVRDTELRSVGIDAEPLRPLPEGVFAAISSSLERDLIADIDSADVPLDTALFCAKEAIFKAWFPSTERWLGFEEAEVRFVLTSDRRGLFTAELLVPGETLSGAPLSTLRGKWCAHDELIVTVVTIPVSGEAD